ncbi:MAG: hypothetical protein HKN43_00095 [Rhodothermales bacterium]|nr:hypothetical protein [Rhodothermales bacterium]
MDRFDFKGTVEKAGLGVTSEEVWEMTASARDNVHTETWYLVDYVNTPM